MSALASWCVPHASPIDSGGSRCWRAKIAHGFTPIDGLPAFVTYPAGQSVTSAFRYTNELYLLIVANVSSASVIFSGRVSSARMYSHNKNCTSVALLWDTSTPVALPRSWELNQVFNCGKTWENSDSRLSASHVISVWSFWAWKNVNLQWCRNSYIIKNIYVFITYFLAGYCSGSSRWYALFLGWPNGRNCPAIYQCRHTKWTTFEWSCHSCVLNPSFQRRTENKLH